MPSNMTDLFGNSLPDEKPHVSVVPVAAPPKPETETFWYWNQRGNAWTPEDVSRQGNTTTIWK